MPNKIEAITRIAHRNIRRVVGAERSIPRMLSNRRHPERRDQNLVVDMRAATSEILSYLQQSSSLLPYEQTKIALAASSEVIGQRKREKKESLVARFRRRGVEVTDADIIGAIRSDPQLATRDAATRETLRQASSTLSIAIGIETTILVSELNTTQPQARNWLEQIEESGKQLGKLLSQPQMPTLDQIDSTLRAVINMRPAQFNAEQTARLNLMDGRQRSNLINMGLLRPYPKQ